MAWRVDFFEEENGRCPAEEFFHRLPNAHVGKILQVVRILREQGPTLPFPYSSQIEGPLRELRIHFGRHHYRVLYYGDPQRVFVMLTRLKSARRVHLPKKSRWRGSGWSLTWGERKESHESQEPIRAI